MVSRFCSSSCYTSTLHKSGYFIFFIKYSWAAIAFTFTGWKKVYFVWCVCVCALENALTKCGCANGGGQGLIASGEIVFVCEREGESIHVQWSIFLPVKKEEVSESGLNNALLDIPLPLSLSLLFLCTKISL